MVVTIVAMVMITIQLKATLYYCSTEETSAESGRPPGAVCGVGHVAIFHPQIQALQFD